MRVIGGIAQGRSVVDIASELAAESQSDDYCQLFAADLHDPVLKPSVICDRSGDDFRVTVDMHALLSPMNLEYALYLLKNRRKVKVFGYQNSPVFTFTAMSTDIDAIQVFVRDTWRDICVGYYPWPRNLGESAVL